VIVKGSQGYYLNIYAPKNTQYFSSVEIHERYRLKIKRDDYKIIL
jgi:hypothetical protein